MSPNLFFLWHMDVVKGGIRTQNKEQTKMIIEIWSSILCHVTKYWTNKKYVRSVRPNWKNASSQTDIYQVIKCSRKRDWKVVPRSSSIDENIILCTSVRRSIGGD